MASRLLRGGRVLTAVAALGGGLLLGGCSASTPPEPDAAPDVSVEIGGSPASDAPSEEAPPATEEPAAPAPPQGPVLPADTGASPFGIWTAPDGSSAYLLEDGSCSGMYYNAGQPLDIGGPMTCVVDGDRMLVRQPPNQATYTISVTDSTLNFISGGVLITFRR